MHSGTLILGECLDAMRRLKPSSVDMVLADLPYGTTANKWDSVIPFDSLWGELLRVAKPTAALVFTASQPFTSALVMSQPKLFRHEWIWQKAFGSNALNSVREPLKEHESVCVFSRGGWTYNPVKEERRGGGQSRIGKKRVGATTHSNNYGSRAAVVDVVPELRLPSTVQFFTNQRGLHPTQKPVALFEYLIRTYSNPGDVILDPTAGSGTTAVAAHNTGRRWVCIERDEKYFDVASNRLAELAPSADVQRLGALF